MRIILILIISSSWAFGQLSIQWEGEDQFNPGIGGLTPLADKLGRPFLYVAANEAGLKIYDVSSANPVLVQAVDTIALTNRPMSVSQRDSLLYVCVGSHFGNSNDPPSLAIVDVSNPLQPALLDIWTGPTPSKGAGVVRVQGNYAYLGAMYEGLIILDISNPNSIGFVSQLIPSISFPHSGNTQEKVNARGMDIVDTLVYLCYDAGGLRVINCADINNPVEIGQFANNITVTPFNMPRAYNNVVVDDSVAYVAVDYCGLEIIDVRDPSNIQMLSHYNPHNCPTGQWNEAPIHANELILQKPCKNLFVSTGKSELLVLDISDPYLPMAIDSFGTVLDTTATWGVDVTDDYIYLTYLHIPTWIPPILVPFYSEWNGVKKLSYSNCGLAVEEDGATPLLYPNPVNSTLFIEKNELFSKAVIVTAIGQEALRIHDKGLDKIDVSSLPEGIYYIKLVGEKTTKVKKFVIER